MRQTWGLIELGAEMRKSGEGPFCSSQDLTIFYVKKKLDLELCKLILFQPNHPSQTPMSQMLNLGPLPKIFLAREAPIKYIDMVSSEKYWFIYICKWLQRATYERNKARAEIRRNSFQLDKVFALQLSF